MAQVKKKQTTTPTTEKFQEGGSLSMNGKTLFGQKARDRMKAAYAGSPQDEREMWSLADRAIAAGHHVTYDPGLNTISITDADGNDVTGQYDAPNARVNDSGIKKEWNALFNDRTHRFKKSGRYMAMINMDPNEPVAQKDLIDLVRGDDSYFVYQKDADKKYVKDENGNYVYDRNSPTNASRRATIGKIRNYLDNVDGRSGYRTTNWANGTLNTLTNAYDSLSADDKMAFWNNFYANLENGTLDPAQQEYLNLFGYKYGFDDANASAAAQAATWGAPKDWTGNRDTLKNGNVIITKGADGKYHVSGENKYKNSNWYLGGTRWAANTPYSNGFLLNGTLYSENDVLNNPTDDIRELIKPWISVGNVNWNDWYNRANASNLRFEGDRIGSKQGDDYYGAYASVFNPTQNYSHYWNNTLAKIYQEFGLSGYEDSLNVADATQGFTKADGTANTIPILSFVIPGKMNGTGVPIPYYTYKGADEFFTNPEELASSLGIKTANRPYGYAGKFESSNYEYMGNGDYAKALEVVGSGGSRNTIVWGKNGKFYLANRKTDGTWANPIEIKNTELLKEIFKNPRGNYSNRDLRNELTRVPSHQFGGPIAGNNTSHIVTDTNNSKTDISKPHKLNGADGGLTDQEKVRLAAAVGDLVGMGLAFVPGANIASVGTGVTSSLAMFGADVSQDGLDWGDVGKLGLNLIFDTATIAPFAGGLAKSAKVAKTLKSVGSIAIKALSLAGMADGAAALKDIINGKEATSEDLQRILYGLSATVAGTVSTVRTAQDAKLAKKLEETLNKSAGDSLASFNSKKFTLNGHDVTRAELNDLVNGKTADQIKEALKPKYGEVTDESLKGLLTEAGYDWKKVSGWMIGNKNRGEQVAQLKLPASAEKVGEHTTFGYFSNPFARNSMITRGLGSLGSADAASLMYGQGAVSAAMRRASLATPQLFKEGVLESGMSPSHFYREPGKAAWGSDQYSRRLNTSALGLPDGSAEPHVFGETYIPVGDGGVKGKLELGPVKYGTAPIEQQPTFPDLNTSPILPTVVPNKPKVAEVPKLESYKGGYLSSKSGNKSIVGQSVEKSSAETRLKAILDAVKSGKMNSDAAVKMIQEDNDLFSLAFDVWNGNRAPISGLLFKNGGVLKFQPGGSVDLSKYIESVPEENIIENDPVLLKAQHKLYNTDEKYRNLVNTNIENGYGSLAQKWWKWNYKPDALGGTANKDIAFNLPNIDDMANAGLNVLMAQKNNKLQKDMIDVLKRRQFQTPEEQLKAYNFDDINVGANSQREAILARPLVGSDMNSMIAQNEVRNQQLAGIEANRASAIGQRKSQIDEYNLGAINRNTASRIGTANTKSQYITGLDAQKIGSDIETNNTIMSQILNPLSQQLRSQNRTVYDQMRQFEYNRSKTAAEDSFKNRVKSSDAYNRLYNQWLSEKNAGTTNFGFEDWIQTDLNRANEYNTLFTKDTGYFDDMWDAARKYTQSGNGSFGYRYKKGGYVRSSTDQIAIDTNRNAQKASRQFSESLQKTLLQLMKIK